MSERLIDGLTVKLPLNVRETLRAVAKDRDKPMSELARQYILDGLKADGVEI